MGLKYIVLGRRAGNTDELLADSNVEFGKQKEILHKNSRNEKFEEVQMFMLQPHTRAYHPAATLKMEADIKAQPEKAAAEKAAAEKAAAELNQGGSQPANEFKVEELEGKGRGELLTLATGLVAAGRLEALPEGNKSKIIAAILLAGPKP